ncbi:ZP domain-containing protein-like, partial [Anneissia japonica]|uniref:ZP domain-containing protein-like n=1 Tax=Anneissia japonica TaxID=1529436 RepID=UPI001425756E
MKWASFQSTVTSTTYHNQIIVSKDSTSMIYREDDLHIDIQCQLDNRGRSSVNFDPVVLDYFKREHGNFTFTMELYTDDDYSTPYPYWEYPVELSLGSTAYVGASVQTFSDDMVLFVDSCKATPNPDSDGNPQYQLIENSCGVDSTVQFDGQQTSGGTSRVLFSFKTFGFNGGYSTVFIHCELSICNGSDWRYSRDCQQRERRDISAPNKLSDTVPIVLGPVVLKKSVDDPKVAFETE